MKTLSITLALTMLTVFGFSQNDQYQTTMKTNIDKLYQSKTIEEFQQVANTFERIAQTESREWLPSYYASYCYIMMAFKTQKPDEIDPYLDIAQKHLDKGFAIDQKESELYVLQGMLHQARISVDFMTRGMVYSQKAQASLEEALKYNSNNPRAYYLMGMNLYSTPKMYGGGPEAALPLFQRAKESYELTENIANDLMPATVTWGKEDNIRMLQLCEGNNQ